MSVCPSRLKSVVLIGLCLAIPGFAWCKTPPTGKHRSQAKLDSTLIWRGDVATEAGALESVTRAWARSGHGRIELQPFNTASGIDAVASGLADLGGSARASSGSAEDQGLTFTPVAWDGLVIITQTANPVSSLTLRQVHDIYFGKILDWSEVGGNPAPIDVYAVASPNDGVEFSLRSLLFGRGTQPVAAPRLYVNTHMLEKGIELNANGLGVDTLADIQGKPGLKALAINGVAPTLASIADGSYPLFTPLYVVTNPLGSKAAATQAFIDFIQSDAGSAALRQGGVLPYADGSALTALDSARREGILATVNASAPNLAPANAASSAGSPAASIATASSAAQTATSSTMEAGADKTYTVVEGDTLSSIARKLLVQPQQLRDWNHLKSDHVQLGQSLRVSSN